MKVPGRRCGNTTVCCLAERLLMLGCLTDVLMRGRVTAALDYTVYLRDVNTTQAALLPLPSTPSALDLRATLSILSQKPEPLSCSYPLFEYIHFITPSHYIIHIRSPVKMVSKTLVISLAFSLVSAHVASANQDVRRHHKEPEDKLKKFFKKIPVAKEILTKRQIPGQGAGGIPGVPGGQAAQPAMSPEQVAAMMQAAEVINKWLGAWNDQNHQATKRQDSPVGAIMGGLGSGLHGINGGLNSAGRVFRGGKREEGGEATAGGKEGEQHEGEQGQAEGSDAERHVNEAQDNVAYPVSGAYGISSTSSVYNVYPTTAPTYPVVSMPTSVGPAEEATPVEEVAIEAPTTIPSTTQVYSTVVHYSEGTPAMTYQVQPSPTYAGQLPTTLITQTKTNYVTVPAAPTEYPVPETKQPEEKHDTGVPIKGEPTEEHKEEVPPTEEQPKEEPTEKHDVGVPIKGEPEEKHDVGVPIKGEPGQQTPGYGTPYPPAPGSDYPSAPQSDYPSAPQSNHTSGGHHAGYPVNGWMGETKPKAHGGMKDEKPKAVAHDHSHADAHPEGYITGSDPAGYESLQGGAGGKKHEGSEGKKNDWFGDWFGDKKHGGTDGKKPASTDYNTNGYQGGNGNNGGGYQSGYPSQHGAADDKKQSTGNLGFDTLAKLGINFQAHRR